MTNGGTGPYNGSLLLITSGRGPLPPSIVLVNPKPPNNATVLLDNFFGRQFDSLNDIKVHPSGKIFFTDVMCVTSHKDFQVLFFCHFASSPLSILYFVICVLARGLLLPRRQIRLHKQLPSPTRDAPSSLYARSYNWGVAGRGRWLRQV